MSDNLAHRGLRKPPDTTAYAIIAVSDAKIGWRGRVVNLWTSPQGVEESSPGKLGAAIHGVGCHGGPALAASLVTSYAITSSTQGTMVHWVYVIADDGMTVHKRMYHDGGSGYRVLIRIPWDPRHTPRLHNLA